MPHVYRTHRCEPCGKWSYPSRKVARRAFKAIHADHRRMNAYFCPHAESTGVQCWHFGHLPRSGRPARSLTDEYSEAS